MKTLSSLPQTKHPNKIITFKNYLEAWAHARNLGIQKPKIKNEGYNNWQLILPRH